MASAYNRGLHQLTRMQTIMFRKSQLGLTLVELMVAMVIGLITTLVITQISASSEARRRATGGISGAQSTGNTALYMLERDLRLAGYGFGNADLMGCSVNAIDTTRSSGTQSFSFAFQPMLITVNASGSDSIRVLSGSSSLVVAKLVYTTSTTTTKKLTNRAGLLRGDLIVVTEAGSPNKCALFEVTDNTNADLLTLSHATGSYTNETGAAATARYNPTASFGLTFAAGSIYDLGAQARLNDYSVNSIGQLILADVLRGTSTVLAEGVVRLKAQYWDGTAWTTTAPTTPAGWSAVSAIRLGILVRSTDYSKTTVTGTAPAWGGGSFTMTDLGGASDTNPDSDRNWRRYRYRVYETKVPLKNILWKPT